MPKNLTDQIRDRMIATGKTPYALGQDMAAIAGGTPGAHRKRVGRLLKDYSGALENFELLVEVLGGKVEINWRDDE
ncbi:MAG: hypothetical protein ACRC62_15515 [Microcoleus sp.]